MLSGLYLATLLTITPGQAVVETPKMLPPVVENVRPQGAVPTPAETALPPSTSSCSTCGGGGGNVAACSSGYPCGEMEQGPTGPLYTAWNDTSYRMYWLKSAPLGTPLLVSQTGAGPRALLLPSGDRFNFGRSNGGAFNSGYWIDDNHTYGVGFGGLLMEQRASFFRATSDGSTLLARPFRDALTGQMTDFFVANPGAVAGSISVSSGARMSGGEAFVIKNLKYSPQWTVNALVGFRYFDLDEYLLIEQSSRSIGAAPLTVGGTPVTGAVAITDRFRTRNQFYGAFLGLRTEYKHSCLTAAFTAKVGLGNNHQLIDIAGQTKAGGAATINSGFDAVQQGNIGRGEVNRFATLSEVGAELGVQVTKNGRIVVGYDFLYFNDVARPGSQLDSVVNTRLVPSSSSFGTFSGNASPIRTAAHDDFFAYGLRFAFDLRY